jgi:hypothetical protein
MLYLLLLLLAGTTYYLWMVYDFNKQLEIEEDRRVAEVILPIARLLNVMTPEEVDELHIDFSTHMDPNEFVYTVRKHAWRKGIRVKCEETELCYRLIRGIPLNETQAELLRGVSGLIDQVDSSEEGLKISSYQCDN